MQNNKTMFIVIALVVLLLLAYGAVRLKGTSEDSLPPQGKLDIGAVCDGALAYMTFPDGESAEKFVAECKEGKRPEVIENYKKQMGLGDGATI